MPRDLTGYVDPLLSGFAVDYASVFARDLVGPLLAPTIPITKPDAQYAYFGEDVYAQLPETELANNGGRPNRVGAKGELKPVNAIDHGLDIAIDKRDAEMEDAPFAPSERRAVKSLVAKLSLAHDQRVRDKLLAETGRNENLQGNGTEAINKWSGRGGDPTAKIEARKADMIVDPNLMVIGRNVWQALKRNPKIIERVGSVQTTKVVTLETLASLFDIERVVVARGQIGGKRVNRSSGTSLSYIWDDICIMAYVAPELSEESLTAAATFFVRYPEAGNEMWLGRTYDDESSGMRGSRIIFAGNSSDEKIVCPKAFWAIKSVVYVSAEHLERALPEGSGGDASKVNQAIETAQGEVDGYLLSGGYSVPLSPPPENIINYTIDIAVYNLAVMSGFRSDSADNELKVKYDKALDFLRGVAVGKYHIPPPETEDGDAAPPGAGFRVRGRAKMNLGGYWDGRL